MPKFVKSALLPHEEGTSENESDTSSCEEDKISNISGSQNQRITDGIQERFSNENKETTNSSHLHNKSFNISHEKSSHVSTDDDYFVNHNFSLSKQLEVKKTLPSFLDVNPMKAHLDFCGAPRGMDWFNIETSNTNV